MINKQASTGLVSGTGLISGTGLVSGTGFGGTGVVIPGAGTPL